MSLAKDLAGRLSAVLRVGAAVVVALVLASAAARADYLPSVKIGTASLISPTAADAYYGSSTTSTNGLGTTSRPPEIVELARALKNNPDLIYEYVRNSIETVFIYGLQKGALGAEIDKSGTPFDQAMLMVELLRQAGYSANYQAGTITLTGQQFTDWTGISDATAACQLLSSGGIPAAVNGSTTANCAYGTGTAISSVQLAHVWVQVTIGGGTYLFDPSYKPHTFKTGIDLASATGLTSGTPLSQASSGMDTGTTSGVPYVHNLNSEALNSQLTTYASNLLSYMSSNNLNGAEMEDIVGGGVINSYTSPSGGLRQTTLPYTSTLQHSWSGGVPNQYRTTLRAQVSRKFMVSDVPTLTQMFDASFYSDEIYGRKLVVMPSATLGDTYDLVLEGMGTIQEFQAPGGILPRFMASFTLTANHPYAAAADGSTTTSGDYMDATVVKAADTTLPVLIVHGWGDTSANLLKKWADERDSDSVIPIMTQHSPMCFGGEEPCAPAEYYGSAGDYDREKAAASWLGQYTREAQLQAAIAKSVHQMHHALGVAYADTNIMLVFSEVKSICWNGNSNAADPSCTTFIGAPPDPVIGDSAMQLDIDTAISLTSKTADVTARRAGLQAIAASSAALEGSIVAQQDDIPDTSSTATRFEWANRPPSSEDTLNPGVRNFLQFGTSNATVPTGLLKFEGTTDLTSIVTDVYGNPRTYAGYWMNNLKSQIESYSAAGFTIVASQESFLGPGQTSSDKWVNPDNNTNYAPTRQRGGALVATRYDANGDPVEIAHLVVAFDADMKGGGGGVQSNNQATYDPATAADVLKARFIDRSNALGVNLSNGSLSVVSPASIKVGNGDFPYSLTANLIWHPGPVQQSSIFGPTSPVSRSRDGQRTGTTISPFPAAASRRWEQAMFAPPQARSRRSWPSRTFTNPRRVPNATSRRF
ncbi:MAG: transglutaminase domain-containing protein [Proteobacteria bacterium]|nr:transglutaminase domain-containing protein [Pseudomonadota bacterium]